MKKPFSMWPSFPPCIRCGGPRSEGAKNDVCRFCMSVLTKDEREMWAA